MIWVYANVRPLTTYHVRNVIDQAKLSAAFWQPPIEHLRPVCAWLITSIESMQPPLISLTLLTSCYWDVDPLALSCACYGLRLWFEIDPHGSGDYPRLFLHGPWPSLREAQVSFTLSGVSSCQCSLSIVECNTNSLIVVFADKHNFWGRLCSLHQPCNCCCGLDLCPCQSSGNRSFWCYCWRDLLRKIVSILFASEFVWEVLWSGAHTVSGCSCGAPWWVGMCCILFRGACAGGTVGEQSVSDKTACCRVGVWNKSIIVALCSAAVWRIWCPCGKWFCSYPCHAG